ncbi:hypothetical protein [Halorussus sp. MSC15.2]|uniref:hypothetical protein n=1 Tax=Halorussus sp. MSC15.2 TaxID=2283638 RepID=UPI0013D46B88|nr:hypothetical protein [Halorussus sp. MSC15.2]NEU59221.1 hypothetical protein [Halorussus sp. MSC15.2]
MSTENPEETDSEIAKPNISGKDVTFLRTIRTLNATHDVGNEEIGAPATTGRIRELSGLVRSEVQHRLKRSEKMTDLITVHSAPVYNNGQRGPKSAELTEAGEQVLEQVTRGDLSIEGLATPEDIERLEKELVDIKQTLSEFEESPTGAFDEKKTERVNKLFEMMVTFMNAFEAMDVDLDEHRPETE